MNQSSSQERIPGMARFVLVLIAFFVIGAFFLLTEHRAHVLGALPYVLLLACPLMHLFMHGHHGQAHPADDKGNQVGAERA